MPRAKKTGYELYETSVKGRDQDVNNDAKIRWEKLPESSRDIWNAKAQKKIKGK